MKANIVIEFETEEDAENHIEDVRQLFTRRNPLDEPHIEIVKVPDECKNEQP